MTRRSIRFPRSQNVNEEGSLIFSAGTGNAITISDIDVGSGNETVTLTVTGGTLALGSHAGLVSFSPDNAASITLTGTMANINNALEGLTYTGNLNFNGTDTLTVNTNDNGNTGAGGPKIDSDPITINVAPVNDAPVVTAGHTLNYTENQAATAMIRDRRVRRRQCQSRIRDGADHRQLRQRRETDACWALTNQNGITGSFNAATGTLTLTGSSSVANYQTALNSVTYFNTSDNPSGAARTVTIITNDGALNSVAVTDTINVTPVNDAPVGDGGSYAELYREPGRHRVRSGDHRVRRRQRQSRIRNGADHRQLRQRRGRAGLHQPERHHRHRSMPATGTLTLTGCVQRRAITRPRWLR